MATSLFAPAGDNAGAVTQPRFDADPGRSPSGWQKPPVRLRPSRVDLTDAGFVLALVGVALVGFQPVFGGLGWLWAGAVGAVTGVLVAHVCAATRQLAVVTLCAALGVTVLCSGVLFGDLAVAGVLPSAASARESLEGSLRGWHDILTVVPPVGRTGNLLAVPFAGALAAALVGYSLARRARRPGIAALAPVALLVSAILIGSSTTTPDRRVLVGQGVAMAVLGLLWGVAQQRRRLALSGGRLARRPLATVLTLVLASAFGALALTQLGTLEAPRVVLRDRVVPPFDPSQYGSPLAGFRTFTNTATRDRTLFSLTGLPAGSTVRLATMDSYDGLVWNVAGADVEGRSASGWFERAGDPQAANDNRSKLVTVEPDQLGGVWVPGAARLTGVRLVPGTTGGSDAAGGSGLFVNDATGTVARPAGLPTGVAIQEQVSLQRRWNLDDVPAADQPEAVVQPSLPSASAALLDPITQAAAEWTQDAKTSRDKISLLAGRLRTQGYLSNGAGGGDVDAESGHGLRRLSQMVQGPYMAGNDEQYAALLAVMLRTQQIPAHVVVGFTVPDEAGTVGDEVQFTGRNAHAWVEVPFGGDYGWVRVDATPTQKLSATKPQTKPKPVVDQNPVPPPVARTDPLQVRADEAGSGDSKPRATSPWPTVIRWAGAVAAGVALLTSPVWALLALKGWRRRRRRTRGGPSQRISAGWREILDLGRDSGLVQQPGRTRREQSAVLPLPAAAGLAAAADAATFAATSPDDGMAELYWQQLSNERSAYLKSLPWRGRWRVRLSPASIAWFRRREA